MTGPSVFSFTAPTSPSRHRTVAAIFEELATPQNKDHIDTARVSDADLGPLLFDRIARFLVSLDVPRGLKALGYKSGDVDELVKGTLPQRRVLDLAREFYEHSFPSLMRSSSFLGNETFLSLSVAISPKILTCLHRSRLLGQRRQRRAVANHRGSE